MLARPALGLLKDFLDQEAIWSVVFNNEQSCGWLPFTQNDLMILWPFYPEEELMILNQNALHEIPSWHPKPRTSLHLTTQWSSPPVCSRSCQVKKTSFKNCLVLSCTGSGWFCNTFETNVQDIDLIYNLFRSENILMRMKLKLSLVNILSHSNSSDYAIVVNVFFL